MAKEAEEMEFYDPDVKDTRRGFFGWMFFGLWALLNIGGIAAAVIFLLKALMPSTWVSSPYIYRKVYVSSLNKLGDSGAAILFEDKENHRRAILINNNGKIQAFSLTCPHLGCQVKWGEKEREFICPCHNARFFSDGRVKSGPPPKGLESYRVIVENNLVFIEFKEPMWQPEQYFGKI